MFHLRGRQTLKSACQESRHAQNASNSRRKKENARKRERGRGRGRAYSHAKRRGTCTRCIRIIHTTRLKKIEFKARRAQVRAILADAKEITPETRRCNPLRCKSTVMLRNVFLCAMFATFASPRGESRRFRRGKSLYFATGNSARFSTKEQRKES